MMKDNANILKSNLLEIEHIRKWYSKDTTIGKLYVNGKFFCYTLEDTLRPFGIKVSGHTGIADNEKGYRVGIRFSNKFKREVVVIYTEEDGVTLKHGGISFKYVYAHGGNKHEDTEGCVLVAFNRTNWKIYGTAEAQLFSLIKEHINTDGDVVWKTTHINS
jgi:hypothetical protein